ncbi:sugar fermentation stimulation protein A [Enterococcus rivorum]|uniref:Sugar fermentation stimulation protein homolog n=1 Tax=Enterococcus rivorum TaxID=762845 RepID=A0A1E5KVC8_9ENTE|nr:DNA/RNA nuclease SfsA [Enterococcus rivorum]MBP2098377.1 sugar fermentation stimulation protein A [Enterococcus rivorum]OEH81836.1 sugar fermentation stimulation protein SfsA [Enterococcus rivorum]
MIIYPEVHLARFIKRPNRFIAECQLIDSGEIVTVHVKNTGRCKELLFPDTEVALSYQASEKRKTDYDLIAVKKVEEWINIDSQVPNQLASEGLLEKKILLPGLAGEICSLKREQKFGNSKFDILVETDQGEQAFVEVKGMTLENNEIGAFPDAPTIRGLKHVEELIKAKKIGYQCYVLFIIQFEKVKTATIHEKMQPSLAEAISLGQKAGVHVLAYSCQVSPATIDIQKQIPFELNQEFEDPNR